MSAFNNIGATWAGGNKALLTDILRNEWGFRGTVITDWSTGDVLMPPDQGIRAGNDIWLNPKITLPNRSIGATPPTFILHAIPRTI